ncbi:molybdopterin-dependent oxidoreductase [Actinoplanes bogorensis]|uniref:Molybdopterin-dependent oxidoreductase n=1 Tax=Paractinoplanes bogorensis TaxID=1610840 RepID=A0ABS5YK46_9ACTN|nr:molybdopterin-dependent oxidoreductase [Actinoplanes bogorensis]MBU2663691.1 molybdopterin-dependent oxidoreductase [Actinoplanes bogorensis]
MVRDPRPALRRLARWLLAPPDSLRKGPFEPGAFPSRLRSERLTSLLGIALGVAFAVCFGTGLLSHLIQHPPGWFWWPSRPVGLYRFTQGLHVATGLACVPLLGAKLWSVYPRLFTWPPVRSLAHAAERGSVALLVAAALFQVLSGVLNVAHWYAPMPFFFTTGHYRVAWLVAGAILVHIGVQLPVVRAALRRPPRAVPAGDPAVDGPPIDRADCVPGVGSAGSADVAGTQRRRLLVAVGAAVGLITVTTAGQTIRPLDALALLAPRRPDLGPQGLPVNKTAAAAGTSVLDMSAYRLVVDGPGGSVELDLAALNGLPQHAVDLPITCVEGWSADARWSGVRLADLVRQVGADPRHASVLVESLEAGGRYRSSTVAAPHTRDPATLIALRLNGEVLHPDHGYPARLIAPNRPGVLQTKWVGRLTVRAES